jgi:hypothetical protein
MEPGLSRNQYQVGDVLACLLVKNNGMENKWIENTFCSLSGK